MPKNKLFIKFLLIFAVVLLLPLHSLAHSGGTDEHGGHYDNSTGQYHYHHGYPAHQHKNSVCPYDFDDATAHRYGIISQSTVDRYKTDPLPKAEAEPILESVEIKSSPENFAPTCFFLITIGALLFFLLMFLPSFQNIAKNIKENFLFYLCIAFFAANIFFTEYLHDFIFYIFGLVAILVAAVLFSLFRRN